MWVLSIRSIWTEADFVLSCTSPCYAEYVLISCGIWQLLIDRKDYAINNNLTPFISMQNHLNLVYREEEREMLPTLKVSTDVCTALLSYSSSRSTSAWGPSPGPLSLVDCWLALSAIRIRRNAVKSTCKHRVAAPQALISNIFHSAWSTAIANMTLTRKLWNGWLMINVSPPIL